MENLYEDEPDYDFDEDYENPDERWEDECGYDPTFPGICHHIGTEHCSFWCPFHATYFSRGE